MKLTSIDPVQPSSPQGVRHSAQAEKAAREFEAVFVGFMVKAMRTTVGDNPLMPASMGEKIYTDMLDTEYSRMLSEKGTLGLADLILKQIEPEGAGAASLDALKTLQPQPWMFDNRFIPGRMISEEGSSKGLQSQVARWDDLIQEASRKFNVDPALVSAVVARESSGNPAAVSKAGAKGLMQLMDSTAQEMDTTDSFDPRQNIMGGTRYLRAMLDRFGGDERKALASYNAGPAAVEKHNGIPPYPETQDYVLAVQRLKNQFAAAAVNKDVPYESSSQ